MTKTDTLTDLDRLVAIDALRDLQSRYARLADARDWHALADLFVPDGSFIPLLPSGEPQATMTGRDEIVRTIAAGIGAGKATHHLFSFEIAFEGPDRATGVWSMEDWIDRSDDPDWTPAAPFRTLHGRGHYHVAYEKRDGRWFIARQVLHRALLEIAR